MVEWGAVPIFPTLELDFDLCLRGSSEQIWAQRGRSAGRGPGMPGRGVGRETGKEGGGPACSVSRRLPWTLGLHPMRRCPCLISSPLPVPSWRLLQEAGSLSCGVTPHISVSGALDPGAVSAGDPRSLDRPAPEGGGHQGVPGTRVPLHGGLWYIPRHHQDLSVCVCARAHVGTLQNPAVGVWLVLRPHTLLRTYCVPQNCGGQDPLPPGDAISEPEGPQGATLAWKHVWPQLRCS